MTIFLPNQGRHLVVGDDGGGDRTGAAEPGDQFIKALLKEENGPFSYLGIDIRNERAMEDADILQEKFPFFGVIPALAPGNGTTCVSDDGGFDQSLGEVFVKKKGILDPFE